MSIEIAWVLGIVIGALIIAGSVMWIHIERGYSLFTLLAVAAGAVILIIALQVFPTPTSVFKVGCKDALDAVGVIRVKHFNKNCIGLDGQGRFIIVDLSKK